MPTLNPEPPALSVLVVDDHPVFLAGLQMLVQQTPGLRLAGAATSAVQAIDLAAATEPDVVVMDVSMPGMSGVEATARIVQRHPGTAVLVLTMFESEEYVLAALRAGARGYLIKGSAMREIAQAIVGVANGQATFGPTVAARVLAAFGEPDDDAPPPPFPQLTDREREVLSLLAKDLGNIVIARRLGIEPKTVRNYVSGIIVKLQVADRESAGRRARDAGLG